VLEQSLQKILGEDCYREKEETKDKWLSGKYKGYLDWMSDTVNIHMKYGLTKDMIDQLVMDSVICDGAEDLF
jgi:phosphoserine phosphatase